MKTTGSIIKKRLKDVKSLMEYLDSNGDPKYPKAQEYFFYDWIQGNTIYKNKTNKLIKLNS